LRFKPTKKKLSQNHYSNVLIFKSIYLGREIQDLAGVLFDDVTFHGDQSQASRVQDRHLGMLGSPEFFGIL
jgi:hypothetical protein